MLAHVTFHNSNSTSAIEWVNYNSVLATLEEMETGYTAFQRIDVTVDSNPTNAFVRPLRRWAVERQLRRVRLRVSLHARLPHPFRLAWAHREHMERAVLSGRYDWFLYTEADVFVPSLAMRVQVQLALKLYAQTQLLLGFARVSNDTQNRPNPSPNPDPDPDPDPTLTLTLTLTLTQTLSLTRALPRSPTTRRTVSSTRTSARVRRRRRASR